MIPKIVTPEYEAYLPVSKTKIMYRPFLVKEEKILMIADSSDSIKNQMNAIKSVVSNCTFNKIDVNKLALADIEYLFVMIRAKSVGETIKGEVECKSCGESNDYTIELEHIKMHQDKIIEPNIRLSDDLVITMQFPGIDSTTNIDGKDGMDMAVEITAACVKRIAYKDDIYEEFEEGEVKEFLENLTSKQLEMVSEFMESVPKIVYEDRVNCKKCGSMIFVYTEGIQNFFV